ncbi:unnamed protein product [Allacma fusca]|uniref:DUF4371 domain-containing protein n=1 Tax=Allacma fusca TaxID=39272 RepID=A0A8J2K854_9HEXA|nr:unnamed protein product [Allacma fusca]
MPKSIQTKLSDWVIKRSPPEELQTPQTLVGEVGTNELQNHIPWGTTEDAATSLHPKEKETNMNDNQDISIVDDNGMYVQKYGTRSYHFPCKQWDEFRWLKRGPVGSVLCKIFREGFDKNMFLDSKKINGRFITEGYNNWKHGTEKLLNHESSDQHNFASMKIAGLTSKPIHRYQSEYFAKSQSQARNSMRALFSSVIYLARQGLPLLGHSLEKGNFVELLDLRKSEIMGLSSWLEQSKSFTFPPIQNEILKIVSHAILRNKIKEIKTNQIFSLIINVTTDVSVKEQVSFCVRTVNDDPEIKEDFLGLYNTSSTNADSLAALILDVFKRFDLELSSVRGQCYDGASNMSGKLTGVSTQIQEMEKRAIYVHCYAHSLNLAVQDVIRNEELLRDCLSYVNDIGVLLKGSAKRFWETFRKMENLEFARNASDFSPNVRLHDRCPISIDILVRFICHVLLHGHQLTTSNGTGPRKNLIVVPHLELNPPEFEELGFVPFTLIDTRDDFLEMMADTNQQQIISLDYEFPKEHSYYGSKIE